MRRCITLCALAWAFSSAQLTAATITWNGDRIAGFQGLPSDNGTIDVELVYSEDWGDGKPSALSWVTINGIVDTLRDATRN